MLRETNLRPITRGNLVVYLPLPPPAASQGGEIAGKKIRK